MPQLELRVFFFFGVMRTFESQSFMDKEWYERQIAVIGIHQRRSVFTDARTFFFTGHFTVVLRG